MKIRNYEKDRQNTIKYSVGNIKKANVDKKIHITFICIEILNFVYFGYVESDIFHLHLIFELF